MAKQLTLFFLLAGHILFAQNTVPTQFDRFVDHSKIEWAAYASDSFNFSAAGLNMLLLNRLTKNEIKASLPIESRTATADDIKYTKLDSIDHIFYGDNEDETMDAAGNVITNKRAIPQKDNNNFKLTQLTQILFIEKGILKSYIPFVAPTLPVVTSTGQYLGERLYFASCFNYKYNSKPSRKSKLIFLRQTKKILQLNPEATPGKLKEMYGHNLVETLWPYVLQNKIKAFSMDNRQLKPEDLNVNLGNQQPAAVPVYDSAGNVVKYMFNAEPVGPEQFTRIEIVQDWYYDPRKNKVFSFITEMILYVSKPNEKEEMETVPVLKLVY